MNRVSTLVGDSLLVTRVNFSSGSCWRRALPRVSLLQAHPATRPETLHKLRQLLARVSETDRTFTSLGPIFPPGWLANKLDRLDRGPEWAKGDVRGGFVPEPEAESQRLENQVDGQLRLGLRSFLVRSRRGSVVGGGLHLFFCVCWVFQGRITLGWRGLSMATSPSVSVYSCTAVRP